MRAITAGVLAVALLAAGCAGSDEPRSSGSPSPGSSPTASPSPAGNASAAVSADPAPAPAPPPATNDRAGREAFARYVLQAWIYALNTNDPTALLDVSGRRACGGCAELADELGQRRAEGWYVGLDAVEVSRVEITARGDAARAVLAVTIPESRTFHEDGSFRSTNPAHPRSTFEVDMVHERGRFRLVSFSLY